MLLAAENGLAGCFRLEPGNRPVDDVDGQGVAGFRIVIPGEKAVAFENDALGGRVFKAEFFQPQAQFIARTLPGQPADLATEDLLRQLLRIGGSRNRDDRVGMHVIDMLLRHIGMQRRVDGGGAGVEVEGAMRQIADHLVFECDAAIDALQRAQLVHIKSGKTVHLDRADIAARTLDPENLDQLARQRVLLHHLGRGIAAAIIGHALVRAEEV